MPATQGLPVVISVALGLLLLASAAVPPWELFHDELYYWAGAQRLGFGYVDHPPLAPWILRLSTSIAGDGVLGFRIVPALCGAVTAALTARMAWRFGAGVWGQSIAALAIATAPIFLTFFSFYSVNAIELLLWCGICLALVEWIEGGHPRLWLLVGVLVGIAALNKHTVALLAAALALGLLASPLRSTLRERWIWIGAALGIAIALPNGLWNLANGWPSLEFYRSRSEGILPASVADALALQISMTNPANWLLVVPGLATLLVSERMKRFRPLGIAFALLLVGVLFSGQRRGDRIAGVYPIVFAAGAVAWEHVFGLLRDGRERGRWASMLGLRRSAAPWRRPGVWGLQAAIPISILALGALLLPISLPIFAPARVEAFFKAIDERPAIETGDVDQWLPLTLSGRLGWRRFSEEVYAAVDRLPVELRERSVLLTPHWLYASVLEYYGRERGGPPVVSPHNAYAFWSGSADDRDQVITVAISRERVDSIFGESRELAIFRCEVCTAWRGDLPIRLAPAPAGDGLSELLERWRFYSIGRVPALTP